MRRTSDEGVSEVVGSVLLVAVSVVALSGFGLVVLSTVTSDATVVPTASFELSPETAATTLGVSFVSGTPFPIADANVILLVNGTDRIASFYVDSAAADGRFHPGDTLRFNLTSPALGAGANIMLLVVHKETGKQIGVGRATVLSAATLPAYVQNEVDATADVSPDIVTADGSTLATITVTVGSEYGRVLVSSVEADLSSLGGVSSLTLSDEGTDGDATAADGIFTGQFTVAEYTFGSNPAVVSIDIPYVVRDVLGHEFSDTVELLLRSPPISKVVSGAIYRPLPSSAAVGSLYLTNFTLRNGGLLDNDQLEIHVSDLEDSTIAWTALVSFNNTDCVTWVNLTIDGLAGGASLRPASGCFQIGPDAELDLADPSASIDQNGASVSWVLVVGDLATYGYDAAGLSASNEAIITFLGDTTSAGLSQLGLGQSDLLWDTLGSGTLTAPTAPPSLLATAGNTEVSLSWSAPASDGGSAITGYKIYRSTVSGGEVLLDTIGTNTSYVAAGLTNGQPYYFQVTAVNAIGESARSGEQTATPVAGPSAPQALALVPGNRTVTLSWSAPASDGGNAITGYKIYRSTVSGVETLLDTIGTNTSYVSAGLANGTEYFFRVSAVNAVAEGARTAELSATPSTTPDPPGTLVASAGDAQVQLAWVTPDDGGSGLTGFKIYQTAPGSTVLLATTTNGANTTFTVNGLTNGVTYSFRVAATNANGDSTQSNEASGTPAPGTTVPTAPQTLAAARANASVDLTWSPPTSTGGSPVTAYKIYMGASSGTETFLATTASGANTTFTVNGLTNGVTYFFNITAVNAVGESASSNHASATPAGVPYPPSGLAGTRGNGSVSLSWSAPPSDGSSAITNYRIYANGVYVGATGGANTSFVANGLTNGVSYTFTVTAENAVGESGESNAVTATPATTPNPPAALVATPANGAVTLTWTPGATGGSVLTNYRIYSGTTSGGETLLATTGSGANTSFTANGLTNGQIYYFTIVAVNAVGDSADSNEASATPAGIPSAPTSLAATKGNGTVSLSWTAPATGGSPITGYRIYRGTASGGETLLDTIGTNVSYVSAGLTNGQIYYYTVTALNAVGESAASNEASATPSTVPNPPASLAATATSSSSVTLTWTTPSNGGSSLTTYKIYRGASSGTETFLATTGSGANTSFVVNGLTASTTYWFNVTAVNTNGESSSSNHATATTSAAPSVASTLNCAAMTVTSGSVTSCSNLQTADGITGTFQEGTGSVKLFEANWTLNTTGLTASTYSLQTYGRNVQAAEDLHMQAWNFTSSSWQTISTLNGNAASDTLYAGTIYSAHHMSGGVIRVRVIDNNTLSGGTDNGRSSWDIDYVRLVTS